MTDEIIYMLGIVGVGFAVNYALRALPFLLFAGRSRSLPKSVETLGAYISPIIIAGLIVYAYSGSAWRTPWPYVAGALTVGLQIWKRNPLASIIAGTLLYMVLVNCCGCTTRRVVELDAQHPMIRLSVQGVHFGDELVEPTEVAGILEDCDIPHDRVIHIQLDEEVKDLRPARFLMAALCQAGYRRPVLVTKRHAESQNLGKRKPSAVRSAASPGASPAPRRQIRYKRATE